MHILYSPTRPFKIPGWGRALILSAGAFALWALSLRSVDPDRMTDLGLISILPVSYFVAVIALIATICTLIHFDHTPDIVYMCLISLLIVMIHGVPPLLYKTLRYPWAWKHAGIVDYILRHHSIDPAIRLLNAYHNWPGFFAHDALLSEIAGLNSALLYAPWAETFFNLAEVGALYMIFQGLTDSKRITWLGILIFYLANWIGQDYYAPQSLAFFLYLTIVGIALRWYRSSLTHSLPDIRPKWIARTYNWIKQHAQHDPEQQIPSQPHQRMGLIVLVLLMIGTIVVSHQLTPLMLFASVLLLSVAEQINTRTLPVIILVLILSFVLFGATSYLTRNATEVTGSIGQVSENFDSNITDLSQVSAGHRVVAMSGRILTLFVWLLAIVGGMRRFYAQHVDLAAVILVLAPCLIIFGNAYGGEIVFRTYLFTIAGIAFFGSAAVYPDDLTPYTWYTGLGPSIAVCLVLFAGFFLAYFGKEQLYYLPVGEVQAADYVYTHAPPDTLLIVGSDDFPHSFKNYENFTTVSLVAEPSDSKEAVMNDPADVLANWMSGTEYAAAYIIITTHQKRASDTLGLLPPGSLEAIESALLDSDHFTVIYQNQDARVFVLNESG